MNELKIQIDHHYCDVSKSKKLKALVCEIGTTKFDRNNRGRQLNAAQHLIIARPIDNISLKRIINCFGSEIHSMCLCVNSKYTSLYTPCCTASLAMQLTV